MFKNRTIAFVVLTFILTGLYSLLYLIFPIEKKVGMMRPDFIITALYMFIPLISTLILQVFVYREPVKEIGIKLVWSNWYFVAALLPIFYALATLGVSLFFPDMKYDPELKAYIESMSKMLTPEQMELAKKQMAPMMPYMMFAMIFQALFLGVVINSLFAFGEEAGWRGFMLNSLKGRNFFLASFIIGIVWGLWHAPVIIQGHNYPEHPFAGIFLMAVWTVLLTPLIAYVTIKSGSVIAAAIFHGVLNASAGIPIVYISGGNDLIKGETGLAGFIALAIFNILLFIYDRYMAKEKIMSAI